MNPFPFVTLKSACACSPYEWGTYSLLANLGSTAVEVGIRWNLSLVVVDFLARLGLWVVSESEDVAGRFVVVEMAESVGLERGLAIFDADADARDEEEADDEEGDEGGDDVVDGLSAAGMERVLLVSEVVRDFSGERPSGAVRKDFSGLSSPAAGTGESERESESEEEEELTSSRALGVVVAGCGRFADGGREAPALVGELSSSSDELGELPSIICFWT